MFNDNTISVSIRIIYNIKKKKKKKKTKTNKQMKMYSSQSPYIKQKEEKQIAVFKFTQETRSVRTSDTQ